MAQNKEEIVVALDGAVLLAPFGTTLPAKLAAPSAPFEDLGYQSSDGVSFSVTPSVTDIEAWQSATPVRKIVTARALTVKFTALQWNVSTFAAAFGGGSWSELEAAKEGAPGIFRYDPPADEDSLESYSAIVDFHDGDKDYRLVVEQVQITDSVETNLARSSAATLPLSLDALTPDGKDRSWFLETNDPAVDVEP